MSDPHVVSVKFVAYHVLVAQRFGLVRSRISSSHSEGQREPTCSAPGLPQQAPKGQTDVTVCLRVPCACCRVDLKAYECHRPRMSSPASPPPPPSSSSSPGILVYVIVLIGVAALFSLGGLVRFCHHTVRGPARTGPGTAPRSVLEVSTEACCAPPVASAHKLVTSKRGQIGTGDLTLPYWL